MPKLILKEKGAPEGKTFSFEREEIALGRAAVNNVVLDSAGVSRKHAKIFPDGADFYIIDLGSAGGTKLNGLRVPQKEKYILKHNDIINIDKYDIKFQAMDELLTQSFNEITDSDILEVKLLKKVLRALDKETIPSVEVLNGASEGKKLFIADDMSEAILGRDPMADFQIEEYVVSRRHAKISRKWGGIVIQDLQSKNGVYINNRRVTEEALHDGDRIALGTVVLMFRNPKEINLEEVSRRLEEEKRVKEEERRAALDAQKAKEEPPPPAPFESPHEKAEPDEDVSETAGTIPEEEQKKLASSAEKMEYPAPRAGRQRIKFNAIELCFIGLGVLVFIFAIIMILNLVLS
jgi:pSer/pThr/pTyr-binding forkhead associated (FHA) protein